MKTEDLQLLVITLAKKLQDATGEGFVRLTNDDIADVFTNGLAIEFNQVDDQTLELKIISEKAEELSENDETVESTEGE